MNLQSIYDSSPYLIQSLAFKLYAERLRRLREDRGLMEKLEFLSRMDSITRDELRHYQDKRLEKLILHCYETVPYYNSIMRSLKLRPSDIRSVSDLPKLPLLTKEDVRKNLTHLKSTKFNKRKLKKGSTSGTTGSPLVIYWDQDAWEWSHAFDWRQKVWGGMELGSKIGVLLGRMIVSTHRNKPPYWMWSKSLNQLWISSFHLSQSTVGDIYSALVDYGIEYLEGYPSTLYTLAQLMSEAGLRLNLKATFTSSEPLFDYQRNLIGEVFNCDNYDYYGLAEKVIWATECGHHANKHLNMEYGITEVVDSKGNAVGIGEEGFLVGTSLLNFGMPLIRYKTSDISSIKDDCCECGRASLMLNSVVTKDEDRIVTPSGKIISPSVLTHPFKPLTALTKSQIVQESIDRVTIKLVSESKITDDVKKHLILEVRKRIGDDIIVSVEQVDTIEKGANGKYRWVVSRLHL